MLLSIFYVLASLLLFYLGATWLVKGSTSLALNAGVSSIVVGLTIVAIGTSTPELAVSINASITGHGNIAIGNIIGSNLFNIFIIIGISAIVSPLKIVMKLIKIQIPILVITTIGFMLLFADREISRVEGGILVFVFLLFATLNIILARREKNTDVITKFEELISDQKIKWYWAAGSVILGIGLMVAGSELLMQGAVSIAHSLGVGETIIGLTIIAASTSIPLLVTSIYATIRKEYDIVIGTVIGASIFNILGIIGISALINPLSAIAISNIDLYVMIGTTLLLLQFLRSKYILKRDDGIFMIGMYLIYLYYLWPK
jgi:cation:H+ antiporter